MVEKLISGEARDGPSWAKTARLQADLVASFNKRQAVTLKPFEEAKAARFATDWETVDIPTPEFTGVRTLDAILPLATLRDFIDWSPFFLTWELRGKYPKIFQDEFVGEEAKKLFDDANRDARSR